MFSDNRNIFPQKHKDNGYDAITYGYHENYFTGVKTFHIFALVENEEYFMPLSRIIVIGKRLEKIMSCDTVEFPKAVKGGFDIFLEIVREYNPVGMENAEFLETIKKESVLCKIKRITECDDVLFLDTSNYKI